MIVLEEQTGLNAGLNRGLKIGKMLKKNVRLRNVSIKNAIKVGKAVAPLATTAMSFVPGGGVAGKLLNSKAGKLFTKVKNGKAVKLASKLSKSKVGKFAINKVIQPTVKNAFSNNQMPFDDNNIDQKETSKPVEVMPNTTPTPAQLETIAEVKGVSAETLSSGTPTGEAVPNEAQIETISKFKDIPMQDLKEEAQTQKEIANSDNLATKKPNYTIPMVIGIGVLGAVVLLTTSSKSN